MGGRFVFIPDHAEVRDVEHVEHVELFTMVKDDMDDGRTDNYPYGWDEAAFEAYWGYDDDQDPCEDDCEADPDEDWHP